MTYYEKCFTESYNFVVGNTSIKRHIQKLFTQSFKHNCSPAKHGYSQGELLRGEQPLNLLPWGATMFLWEHLCLKFYVNIILACEFYLKCFQLQSCNFLQDLPNDRSQSLYKNNYVMTIIVKKFKTYVSLGNLNLSLGKFIVPEEVGFPQGTIMSLGKRSLSCLWGTTLIFFSRGIIMSLWKRS